jgi:hypothetical protein
LSAVILLAGQSSCHLVETISAGGYRDVTGWQTVPLCLLEPLTGGSGTRPPF